MKTVADNDASIIALDQFILATRDSGYKGTASAVSELVDNAIQAGAKHIAITLDSEGTEPNQEITVRVLDDGCGMDHFTLRQALRFGGSTRFNDRRGLGRYGMGLPNSSMSQARRVTVYSWTTRDKAISSYLDVDEIAFGKLTEVPSPRRAELPIGSSPTKTGTLVEWTGCDRLDNRRVSTIARKLAPALGQTFRFFIWDGVEITINGNRVDAVDPLFLRTGRGSERAKGYGETTEYEVQASLDDPRRTGVVKVTFTELPVRAWHKLPNEEKRALGISKGAGVSVVRAGREVDYGWFFMGGKRKENYDDWFRCQVEFDPELDEAFGITHTKQQIRPQQHLLEALSPDIEEAAHTLNSRIRKAHMTLKMQERFAESERVAEEREHLLPPLPKLAKNSDSAAASDLKRRHPSLRKTDDGAPSGGAAKFRIIADDNKDLQFFRTERVDGQVVLVISPSHPFFKRVYAPLAQSETPRDRELRSQLELLLLAAARAETALIGKISADDLAAFRKHWSDTLATYLNG